MTRFFADEWYIGAMGETSLWDSVQGQSSLGNSSLSLSLTCSSTSLSSSSLSSSPPSVELFVDEPVGSDVNLRLTKKRRKRYRRNENPFPRILKRDLRRLLHGMYFNVVNSGDMTLYRQLLRDICADSCCLVDNLDDRCMSPGLQTVKPIKIRNLTNVADILSKRLSSLPDLVGHLEKSFIRHQLNTPGCLLMAKTRFQGTFPNNKLLRLTLENGEQRYLPYFMVDALNISGRFDAFVGGGDVRIEALDDMTFWHIVEIDAWMIFHLDNDNRIYRIEFHGQISSRCEMLSDLESRSCVRR